MSFDTALNDFLHRLRWTPERLARELNRMCGDGTVSAKAPYHWLRGAYPRGDIPEAVARVLSQHLGEPVNVRSVWPSAVATLDETTRTRWADLTPLAKDSCTSARVAQEAFETNADDATLEGLKKELRELTCACLHVPPTTVHYRATMLRDRVARLLRGRQKPDQRRELLSLGAKLCTLLAWIAEDLGDGDAAYNQASAAWGLAEIADDNEARRWVRVAQSRQSYWAGNFVESGELVVDGLRRPANGRLDRLLELMAGRAWAAAGLTSDADLVLQAWAGRSDRTSVYEFGFLDVQEDRQAYLVGHTLLLLNRPDRALRELRAALDAMSQLPAGQRSYAADLLIRIDIVRALARLGDLADADALLAPAFSLEPGRLIKVIALALRATSAELNSTTNNGRYSDLAKKIEQFLSDSMAAGSWQTSKGGMASSVSSLGAIPPYVSSN